MMGAQGRGRRARRPPICGPGWPRTSAAALRKGHDRSRMPGMDLASAGRSSFGGISAAAAQPGATAQERRSASACLGRRHGLPFPEGYRHWLPRISPRRMAPSSGVTGKLVPCWKPWKTERFSRPGTFRRSVCGRTTSRVMIVARTRQRMSLSRWAQYGYSLSNSAMSCGVPSACKTARMPRSGPVPIAYLAQMLCF